MINLKTGYADNANWGLIPDYMQAGLQRYLTHGIEPGHFLRAVLEGDLYEAVRRADMINQHALCNYVIFLSNYAAVSAYGSKEKVRAWIEGHGALKMLQNDTGEAWVDEP